MLDITPEIIKKPEIKKTNNKLIEKLEKKLLFYLKKAVYQYQMIKPNDKVMVCLSGGKDSYTMLYLLKKLQLDRRYNFDLVSFTLDQSQPGWNDNKMRQWLEDNNIEHVIKTEDTYSFEIIYKGSEFLIGEFPNSKDYYDQTEEKLEKI